MWARKQGTASWTWGVKSPLQDDEGAALHERLVPPPRANAPEASRARCPRRRPHSRPCQSRLLRVGAHWPSRVRSFLPIPSPATVPRLLGAGWPLALLFPLSPRSSRQTAHHCRCHGHCLYRNAPPQTSPAPLVHGEQSSNSVLPLCCCTRPRSHALVAASGSNPVH
jgi:hypothetical protein